MSKYRTEDGTIVDTDRATAHWEEDTRWDGHNQISRATGSQWTHQTLYRSRKGRFYTVHTSQWEGAQDHVEWVSPQEATRWLLINGHPIPEELTQFVDDVEE